MGLSCGTPPETSVCPCACVDAVPRESDPQCLSEGGREGGREWQGAEGGGVGLTCLRRLPGGLGGFSANLVAKSAIVFCKVSSRIGCAESAVSCARPSRMLSRSSLS